MKELIGIAVLICSLYQGTSKLKAISEEVKVAALTKAAYGLPPLSPFAMALTKKSIHAKASK